MYEGIDNEKHRNIVKEYEEGSTTREIAGRYGITSRGVRYVLGRYGVEIKERRRTGGYSVNTDFFKTWSNEMAYVLGFVVTDGNVSGNSLTIAQKERYILEHIKKTMEAETPIRERNNGGNSIHVLNISRKKIIEDLKTLGVTEGKSRTMDMPDVPDEYLPHFIRGVIDGDGWVQDRGYVMNVTNASKRFSYALHNVFNDRGFNGRITKQGNAYRVWVSGKSDVINLADWIYEECGELYLRRKYERFYVNKERERAS